MQGGAGGLGEPDQVLAQFFLEKVQLCVHRMLVRVRPGQALAQEKVQELVVGAQPVEERFHRTAHHAAPGGRAVAGLADDRAQRSAGALDEGDGQFVDVAEVAIEAVGRDPGLARDFAQAQGGDAAVGAEQGHRRRDQVLARYRRPAAEAAAGERFGIVHGMGDRRVCCHHPANRGGVPPALPLVPDAVPHPSWCVSR